jgi:hypothetical protein
MDRALEALEKAVDDELLTRRRIGMDREEGADEGRVRGRTTVFA